MCVLTSILNIKRLLISTTDRTVPWLQNYVLHYERYVTDSPSIHGDFIRNNNLWNDQCISFSSIPLCYNNWYLFYCGFKVFYILYVELFLNSRMFSFDILWFENESWPRTLKGDDGVRPPGWVQKTWRNSTLLIMDKERKRTDKRGFKDLLW